MARPPRRDAAARDAPAVAKRNRRLLAVGLVALACFTIATLPASLVSGTFRRVGLTATAYSGTIWSGAATGVAWREAALGELRWNLRPLALARARAAADVSLARPDGSASATVAATLGGTLELTQLRFDLPLEILATLPTGVPKGWRGQARGEFGEIRLEAGWPVRAQGRLDVNGLVAPRLDQSAIGSFELIAPDPRAATAGPAAVTARVSDKDARLSVDAVLTLAAGRSFQLQGTVAPRGASPQLLQALEFLGPADAAGRRPFGASGTL
jgi:general secretion pathway protein N